MGEQSKPAGRICSPCLNVRTGILHSNIRLGVSAMSMKKTATAYAVLAAALYAINIPLSKLLLTRIPPTMMAAFLYLGAGLGLSACRLLTGKRETEEPLTRWELPYTVGMVVLDIAAPILLMLGLERTNSANAALLNNFEIVATSLIAFLVFREVLSKRLTLAIILVTFASILLSFEGEGSFEFNTGSLLVLGASVCWGFENNCTRMLSSKSSVQITIIKGICSGLGSLIIALLLREKVPDMIWLAPALLLGFVAYGLSINFYIKAQKDLGAAKTSAYYSVAPFLGSILGVLILGERPAVPFYFGFVIMVIATVLMVNDMVSLQHTHEHTHIHNHAHRHGDVIHTHEHEHSHLHTHIHGEEETVHEHPHQQLEGHNHTHS